MNNDVVVIQLDRPRELRYGHKALKTLVAISGKSLEELEKEPLTDFGLVEKFVFCGLQSDAARHGETLTIEQMEDLLDLAPNYKHIIDAVQAAFFNAFGVASEDVEGNG